MDDQKKTSRWAKTLDEAGLLDEIEDGWSLPPGPLPGATIKVKSSFEEPAPLQDSAPPEARGEPADAHSLELEDAVEGAFRELEAGADETALELEEADADALELEEVSDVDALELEEVSDADALELEEVSAEEAFELEEAVDEDVLELVEEPTPLRPSQPPEPLKVPSARETAAGIPRAVTSQPPPPLEPPAKARVVSVRGRRISVVPEPRASVPDLVLEPIFDDPPAPDAHGVLSSVAPGERISRPDVELLRRAPAARSPSKRPRPRSSGLADGPHQRLGELFDVGDFSGALELADEILKQSPGDEDAISYRESCREVLIKMYESRIGSFDQVPRVLISTHDLLWRNLDPTTGFVLSRIDGMSTFEDVVDISGLPRFETCRILARLLQEEIIA